MQSIDIVRNDQESRGSYVATMAGVDGSGRLDYRRERDNLVVATHTESPESFRGKGVGQALVERMVDDARKEGVKIQAVCTFVESMRRRHPEWADAFHAPGGA